METPLLNGTAGNFMATYRPTTLGDIVWPSLDAQELLEDYTDGLIEGHLCLHGDFGTGKTQLAQLVPFALTGEKQVHWDTLLLNCSDTTSKSELIPTIKRFAETLSFCEGGLRFLILDEADRIDPRAQDALKGIIDKYGSVTRFIFTTNHFKKIDGGIKSRCHCMEIGKATSQQWLMRARSIMDAEGVEISDADLLSIIDKGKGSGRDIMQQLERYAARYHRKQRAA
jgi:DNA polymerase III delta prime subunit